MSIPKDFIDRVIEQTNIVDIIGGRLDIKKKGENYWCKCPFKPEKTPSFSINESRQFYHCFSCGAGGNVITFLREYEKLDFVDAVELLARKLGLEVPNTFEKPEIISSKILDHAVDFYLKNLNSVKSENAINYLENRGINKSTYEFYKIGYASDSWESLFQYLNPKFEKSEIEESGLFKKREKKSGYYDSFRDRIMFPIRNIKGNFIGFGGRVIDPESSQPKYLNSPETKLFSKSSELYGLYEAKQSKSTDSLIVVEGYMDVIGLYQYGIKNVVATLGTAITARHISKLIRFTKRIFFAFDGDHAGKRAAWKAVENIFPLLREDLEVKFIFFDEGYDPDSFIAKNGKKAFELKLENSTILSDYFFSRIKEFNLDQVEGRVKAAAFGAPIIKTIKNSLISGSYLSELSKLCELDVDESITSKKTYKDNLDKKKSKNLDLRVKSIINIFKALISYPTLASTKAFNEIIKIERFQFLKIILDAYHQNPQAKPASIIESIENEQIKSFFSQAIIEEMEISEKNATKLVEDCIAVLLKNEKDREEMLKEKYNTESISAHERRELQQLILKKPELGTSKEDQEWLSKLSSKKA